jgi:predicted metal-binding membrane protein
LSRPRLVLARHPEWSAGGVALSAWLILIGSSMAASNTASSSRAMPMGMEMPSMQMPMSGAETPSQHRLTLAWLGVWVVMTAAMMLPGTLPTLRYLALTSSWQRRQLTIVLFLASFLAAWMLFGTVAVAAAGAVAHWLSIGFKTQTAATLALATGWEFTRWKRRAGNACRRLRPLPQRGRVANCACAKSGLGYGLSCVIVCWPLMLAMAVTTRMGLLAMVVIAATTLAQKIAERPRRLVPANLLAIAGLALTLH